jgi:hypothetical protein
MTTGRHLPDSVTGGRPVAGTFLSRNSLEYPSTEATAHITFRKQQTCLTIVEKTHVILRSPRMSNSDVPVRSIDVLPQEIRVRGVRSAPGGVPTEGYICGR